MQHSTTSSPRENSTPVSNHETYERLSLGRYASRLQDLFPTAHLGKADYALGLSLITTCFLLFFHGDIHAIGWDSLNFLFGKPLDFYENCKKYLGTTDSTSYPPSAYLIFALWLFPMKLFGWITSPAFFAPYWVYWLKILTTTVYLSTGAVFYRICLIYLPNADWAKYATAAWLTMPLAVFSQFIFCQCDVFYVLLTMAGFLMFLRGKLMLASLYFGLGVTFKYFPAFVFLPLLLLNEKRVSRLSFCCLIFILPTLVVDLPYRDSPAFIEGVRNFEAINRIYAVTIDMGIGGFLKLYALPASFSILCGLAYFTKLTDSTRSRTQAYFWLISALLPFVFILWHPQWVMFLAPPLALTTMLHRERDRIVLLDLVGMLLFVAASSLIFPDNVDAAMFQGSRLGLEFSNSYWMADLFDWFGDHSRNVFYSGFSAYLILQAALKYRLLNNDELSLGVDRIDYGNIRKYLYVGLGIFLVPAFFVIYRDVAERLESIVGPFGDMKYSGLVGARSFEQTFVATGNAIKQVRVPLELSAWWWGGGNGTISMQIIDPNGQSIGEAVVPTFGSREISWYKFVFGSLPVLKNARYTIRLASPTGPGVAWFGSNVDRYKDGQAIVDGVPQGWDFSFQIDLTK